MKILLDESVPDIIQTRLTNFAIFTVISPKMMSAFAAVEIVRLLGGFTLAVEAAAVYLGQFADDVTCAGFLARLKKEGLEGLEGAARETTEGVLHDEKSLTATLEPTLERLQGPEKVALTFAALLPADQIALPWIRAVVAQEFPEIGRDAEPSYPDPWQNVLRRLVGLRLWQPTSVKNADEDLLVVRMHRLLQDIIQTRLSNFAIFTVRQMKWRGVKNGALLDLMGQQFSILITTDKNIPFQQNLRKRQVSLIILPSNDLPSVIELLPRIEEAVQIVSDLAQINTLNTKILLNKIFLQLLSPPAS